jgi:hypothetical protein
MDLKLTMLLLLIGSIICLAHLTREVLFNLKCKLDSGRWRDIVLRWRQS